MRPPYCAVCDAPVAPVEANLHGPAPSAVAGARGVARDTRDWYCDHHRPGRASERTVPGRGALLEGYEQLRKAQRRVPVAQVRLDALADRWGELMPELARALGLTWSSPAPTRRRTWQPMDGAEPPDCPVTEEVRWDDDGALALEVERAYWAEGDLARAHVALTVRCAGNATRVSGHVPADGSSGDVTELILTGDPLPSEVEAIILAINAPDRAQ